MRGVASVAEWKHHNKMCVCTKASHLLLCQGLIYWSMKTDETCHLKSLHISQCLGKMENPREGRG